MGAIAAAFWQPEGMRPGALGAGPLDALEAGQPAAIVAGLQAWLGDVLGDPKRFVGVP